MTLPSSGNPISLGQIQTEFGGSAPTSISEYYRDGAYTTSNNTNVPTSGRIKFSDFYGAVNEIVKYITATSTNVNASSYFTAGEWSSSAPKRLVINSGVTVGATNTSNYALNIPSGFGGTFKLDNNGSIQGAGGAENSGTGGNAIFAGAAISINNQGTIYSGGGGGGQGGTGGGGYYTYDTVVAENRGYYRNRGGDCGCPSPYYCWPGSQYMNNSSDPCCGGGQNTPGECFCCTENVTYTTIVNTSGGSGGSGGRGQGYDGNLAAGPSFGQTNGPLDGGVNAGRGGTGGTGGDWGTGGGNGFVGANGNRADSPPPTLGTSGGPAYGGLAGFYIVNNANVTWISTGTRAGRVG
jgi:hypothetical protein